MNKMVINHLEKLFVTNDAATILKELEVQHPAAKMIVMAAQMQEKQIGDNTNTVVIFAAALLEHAAELISMVCELASSGTNELLHVQGLKPVEIAEGYELAYRKAAELLPKLVVAEAKDLYDLDSVQKFLKASIMSKQYDNYAVVANLVAKACSKSSKN